MVANFPIRRIVGTATGSTSSSTAQRTARVSGRRARFSGEAVLDSLEPNVRVHVRSSDSAGHLRVHVEITPDHLLQGHWFEFEADQSYLPPVLDQLEAMLKMFPVRGV